MASRWPSTDCGSLGRTRATAAESSRCHERYRGLGVTADDRSSACRSDGIAIQLPANDVRVSAFERQRKSLIALVQRDRFFDVAFVIVAVLSAGVLLYLGRHLTFFYDEWQFLDQRMSPSLDAWMRPHNEHWSLVPVIIYELLYHAFGLTSYVPYLATLTVIHVVAAAGLYCVVSRLAGRAAGLAASMILLLLGPAFEDFFWAMQIGFVGSTASGIWALYVMADRPNRPRIALAAIFMLVSIASSGVGLFFLAGAITFVVATPARRLFWPAIVVPGLCYLTWYLAFGATAVGSHRNPFSFQAVADVPAFVLAGMSAVIGAATSLGTSVGEPLLVVSVAVVAWRWFGGLEVPPMLFAAFAGLLAEFSLVGLVRAQYGDVQAAASRYLYMGVAFALIGAAAALGPSTTNRTARRRMLLPLVATAVVLLNAPALIAGRDQLLSEARDTQAVIEVVERYRDTPSVSDGRPVLRSAVTVGRLHEIVAEAGKPTAATPPTPAEIDRALISVAGAGFTANPATGISVRAISPRVVGRSSLTETVLSDRCLSLTATGIDPNVTVLVPDGGSATLQSDGSGGAQAYIGRFTMQEVDSIKFDLAGEPEVISVPWLQDGVEWLLRIDPPDGVKNGRLCVFPRADLLRSP